MDRIIALIDMDCFYVQVEQRANPQLQGHPCAVVQYKPYKGGGVLAVNYEARALGVSRCMFGDEVRTKFPSVQLARVPESHGKAVLTKYREAGAEVIDVLVNGHVGCVERASIDEAYVDLTIEVSRRLMDSSYTVDPTHMANTVIAGYACDSGIGGATSWLEQLNTTTCSETSEDDKRLAVGAVIVEQLRTNVFQQTGFRCSAGIAHNKVLAKLASGMNKPNKQTILPQNFIPSVFRTTPVNKIRGFGGKLGSCLMEEFGVEFVADLCQFSLCQLQEKLGDKSLFVYNICRGIDNEPVISRLVPQSIGCSKNFMGKEQLQTKDQVRHWLKQLSTEVVDRLINDRQTNNRIAKTFTVSLAHVGFPSPVSASRSCPITRYDTEKFVHDALVLLQPFNCAASSASEWSPAIIYLGLSANKFIVTEQSRSLDNFVSIVEHNSSLTKRAAAVATTTTTTATPTTAKSDSLDSMFIGETVEMSTDTATTLHTAKNCCADQLLKFSVDAENTCTLAQCSILQNESTNTDNDNSISSNVDTEDLIDCEECGDKVSPWSLPEHLDWHFAIKLQEEDQLPVAGPVLQASTTPLHQTSHKKRKIISHSPALKSAKKSSSGEKSCVKTMDAFFHKQNKQ